MSVDTTAVDARVSFTLVNVHSAGFIGESRGASATMAIGQRRALGSVFARMSGAIIDGFAFGSAESGRAGARVIVQRAEDASSAMLARPSITSVRHGNFAQRSRITQWARTREAGHGVARHFNGTSAAILASGSGSCMARVGKLAVLAYVLRWAAAFLFSFATILKERKEREKKKKKQIRNHSVSHV